MSAPQNTHQIVVCFPLPGVPRIGCMPSNKTLGLVAKLGSFIGMSRFLLQGFREHEEAPRVLCHHVALALLRHNPGISQMLTIVAGSWISTRTSTPPV